MDRERLRRLVETLDRPLLALAGVSMVVYLVDLHNLLPWSTAVTKTITIAIDLVFLIDLVVKIVAYNSEYLQSPWFLIDLLSCLPLFDSIASDILPLRGMRFIRGFRILRIFRGLRVLRALKSVPAFEQVMNESRQDEHSRRFHRAMNIGLIALTLFLMLALVIVRRKFEGDFRRGLEQIARRPITSAQLEGLNASRARRSEDDIPRRVELDGVWTAVYFDASEVERRANEVEFFLILGMISSMLILMYIIAYHQLDVTQSQLRGLLTLSLPRRVADALVIDPEGYRAKSRGPATIAFMDFVGFSGVCASLAHDPDKLSMHLEGAMDRIVNVLRDHDMIIDKFIGDAIMSFRGGPLVEGGPEEHARRATASALAAAKALRDLNDLYFHHLKVGVASADDCLIGSFGTSARLSYTILGDAVNLAARLEPASAQCGTRNLFDEATFRLCGDQPEFIWRRWGRVHVAGRNEAVTVYEVFDAEELDGREFLDEFAAGLEAFERGDLDAARIDFLRADRMRSGGDPASLHYIGWCDRLISDGTEDWTSVFDAHK